MTCKYLKILPSIYDFGVKKYTRPLLLLCVFMRPRNVENILKYSAIHYQTGLFAVALRHYTAYNEKLK